MAVCADERVDHTARDDRRTAFVARDPRHASELFHRLRKSGSFAPRSAQTERGHAQHHDVGTDTAYDVVAESELLEYSRA